MTKLYVGKTDVHQCLQFARQHRYRIEEVVGIFYGHIQHFANVLVFVLNLKCLAVIALALTNITRHIDIRQKVHLYFDNAVALTRFTSTTFHVKAETPGLIAACTRFWCLRKQFAHWRKQTRVGGRV